MIKDKKIEKDLGYDYKVAINLLVYLLEKQIEVDERGALV